MSRTPIGWNAAGDTVLIDTYNDVACEPRHAYEMWKVDKADPTACFDRFGDVDKQVPCDEVTTDDQRKKKPKVTARVKDYPTKPTQLAGAKLKVKTSVKDPDNADGRVKVTVTLGGKQILSEELRRVAHFRGVTAWPSPKGDRVMLLVSYSQHGSGNDVIEVRWASLK